MHSTGLIDVYKRQEQNWKKPEFDFSERSDRVALKLEVGQVVYIPGAADILSLIHILQ